MKSQKSAEHEKSTVSVQQKTAKEPSLPVVYRTISFSENFIIPIHLLNTLKYEYLRRELWV
ncbi:MAG: hypothetical protein HGA41_02435, partial [Syntrophaceae bacterium]|nr:hypothetical protein [Syntrophaceae bacterium]